MMIQKNQDIADGSFVSCYQVKRPIDWTEQFGQEEPRKPLDVEIGSGLGEFLVQKSSLHPDRNFVGIEQDWGRVKKILRKINPAFGGAAGNVRILQVDAVVALERLFNLSTIDRVYCLFPCPWPKKKHVQHRLFSHNFFRLLNSRMGEKGKIQIVTDYSPFFDWMQSQVKGTGFKTTATMIPRQFDTKYERKWCRAGQKEFFELALVKKEHIPVPVEEDAREKIYFTDHFDPERFRLQDIKGDVSIILKDFLFDALRNKAIVRVVVAERSMTQHVWVTIVKCEQGWRIARAQGHNIFPTKGVALSLRHIYKTIKDK